MKRDLDLIKKILSSVEDSKNGASFLNAEIPEKFHVDLDTFLYHVNLLAEHQLLKKDEDREGVDLLGLTWKGHDFLDDTRDHKLWNAAKKAGENLSFTAFQSVVTTLAQQVAISILRGA